MKLSLITDTISQDLSRATQYALLWGMESVVLRSVYDAHIPEINFGRVKRILDASELEVLGLIPDVFVGDLQEQNVWMNDLLVLEETLRLSQKIGSNSIIIEGSSFIGSHLTGKVEAVIHRVGELAQRSEKTIVLYLSDLAGMIKSYGLIPLLHRLNNPYLRLLVDPAILYKEKIDCLDFIQSVIPHLGMIVCRDVTFIENEWEETVLGEGDIEWVNILTLLHKKHFEGSFVFDIRLIPKGKMGFRSVTNFIELYRKSK